MGVDVRWEQRFSNDCGALEQLETFFQPPELNEREEQGLIKACETSFELAWDTPRDLLSSEGVADLIGSRDTLRTAFRVGLVEDGAAHIRERYLHCFQDLRRTLELRTVAGRQP